MLGNDCFIWLLLDVDKIVKIESRPISPTKLSKDELLYQMDLKHFDKDEVVEKPEEIKKSRKEQREKPQFKEIEKEKHRFKGKRLWKAYAWAILQFFWLYKVVKNYRQDLANYCVETIRRTMKISHFMKHLT